MKINRKKFFKNVKFESKDIKKYLYEPIFYFAKQNDLERFENITNYVSHATHKRYLSTEKIFKVSFPVTISGTSISKMQIKDSKGNIFNISLQPPNRIIYYEVEKSKVNLFVGVLNPNKDEKRFYTEELYYSIKVDD